MTIVTSVKVRDGLILGTDSMTQIQGTNPEGVSTFLKAYENARKLFQVGNLPIGVMTYGLGNIGERSIESLMHEFGTTVGGKVSVRPIARSLREFMNEKYTEQFANTPDDQKPVLGFFVAGYSRGQVFAEELEFLLPRDNAPIEARGKESFGASWRGIEGPFVRLCIGIDPEVINRLRASGVTEQQVQTLINGLEMPVVYNGMPVQDAVNYAVFVLNTTIGYSSFAIGNPPCGGPLQVATILPDDGFVWISRPEIRLGLH